LNDAEDEIAARKDQVTAMPRKKKTPAAQTPASLRWKFDPNIPTHDFLEDGSPDWIGEEDSEEADME